MAVPPWPLGAAAFALHLGAGVAFPLVPFLLAPAGGAVIGLVGAAWLAGWAAAARFGPAGPATLGAGLGLAMGGALGHLVHHGPAALAIAQALGGAGAGLLVPAARAYAAGLPAGRRDLAYGRLIAFAGLGFLAGLPIVGALVPQNVHLPPLVVAAACALALAATLLVPPPAGEPGVVARGGTVDHGKDG